MKIKISCFFTFLFLSFYCSSQDWKTYPYTPTGSLISFSLDEGYHSAEAIEWWYTTGHITGNSSGTNYSYMLSYFYYPYLGFQGFRILNITNDDTGEHVFDTKPVNYDVLATDKLHIQASGIFLPKIENWKNKKDGNNKVIPFEYLIFSSSGNTEINLEYKTLKRPLILDGDGKFDQGSSSYTYYYSQTKNDVTGTLTFKGITENVTGVSWIDRQYGTFNPLEDEKYEWLSIQLSNGMDINLWNLFTDENTIPDNLKYRILSAYVDESTQYTTKDFNLERLKFNCTPDNEKCYSQQWRLTSNTNNIDLTITVLHNNSEVQLPFRFYEGATSIIGKVNGVDVTGQGFAELLHSYETPIINITNPINGTFNSAEYISWNLTNLDEGNPLLYDVSYSVDNKQTFKTIAEGISDNSYLWENPDITSGENIWFKITAYSIDKTLISTIISPSSSLFTLPVELFKDHNIVLYPNPSSDNLHIDLHRTIPSLTYQLIDINGRVLMDKEVKNISILQLDIENFNSGLYFIKLTGDNKTMHTKFLVK